MRMDLKIVSRILNARVNSEFYSTLVEMKE